MSQRQHLIVSKNFLQRYNNFPIHHVFFLAHFLYQKNSFYLCTQEK